MSLNLLVNSFTAEDVGSKILWDWLETQLLRLINSLGGASLHLHERGFLAIRCLNLQRLRFKQYFLILCHYDFLSLLKNLGQGLVIPFNLHIIISYFHVLVFNDDLAGFD